MKNYIFTKVKHLFLGLSLLCSTSLYSQKIFDLMNEDGVNLKTVQDEAEQYFKIVGTGKGTGYKLFKRWEYHATTLLQGDGTVLSRTAIAEAIESSKGMTTKSGTISNSNWSELGPLGMSSGASGYSRGIGRVTAIYVEPVNQQIIYAGSPGGGLWKSTNGANSWTH